MKAAGVKTGEPIWEAVKYGFIVKLGPAAGGDELGQAHRRAVIDGEIGSTHIGRGNGKLIGSVIADPGTIGTLLGAGAGIITALVLVALLAIFVKVRGFRASSTPNAFETSAARLVRKGRSVSMAIPINKQAGPDNPNPAVHLMSLMHDNGFEVRHTENLREHYALTLMHWSRNLEEHWDEAVADVGLGKARVWKLYLAASRLGFERNMIQLHQVLAVSPDEHGNAGVPLRLALDTP